MDRMSAISLIVAIGGIAGLWVVLGCSTKHAQIRRRIGWHESRAGIPCGMCQLVRFISWIPPPVKAKYAMGRPSQPGFLALDMHRYSIGY
jgi:hypothetical protein